MWTRATWILAPIFTVLVLAFPNFLSAKSPQTKIGCFPMVVAEYCFPGGTLTDLVPIDEILAEGLARAEELKAPRSEPSDLSKKHREKLTEMWRDAVANAFLYADLHALSVDLLKDSTPIEVQGKSPFAPFVKAVAGGPILRLGFQQGPGAAFAYDGKLLIHQQRLINFATSAARGGIAEFIGPLALFSGFIRLMPSRDGYLDAGEILQIPHLRPFVDRFQSTAKAADFSLLGSFGTEVIMILYLVIEEQLRMRSIDLPHSIHFFKDGSTTSKEMDAPQVVWTGQLLLSDEAVATFSELELELLMTHEAMHLMRPNFFMILSAADLTQRLYFPDLNTERTATFMNNLLGRASPGRDSNCPLELSEDDELFTDYYVFYLYRDQPEKQRAYNHLLKRIHTEFNTGAYAQSAFRVRLGDALVEYFAKRKGPRADVETRDALFWQAILASGYESVLAHFRGERKISIEHVLREMEKREEIAIDAKLIRIMIEYYRRKALLKDGWEDSSSTFTLSCEQIGKILDTHQHRP